MYTRTHQRLNVHSNTPTLECTLEYYENSNTNNVTTQTGTCWNEGREVFEKHDFAVQQDGRESGRFGEGFDTSELDT